MPGWTTAAGQGHHWGHRRRDRRVFPVADVAATVVAAAADPRAHGRFCFVATNSPRTQRELLTEVLQRTASGNG